jgi:hypothetical protein
MVVSRIKLPAVITWNGLFVDNVLCGFSGFPTVIANAACNLGHDKVVGHPAKIDTFTIPANMPYLIFNTPKQCIANDTIPSHVASGPLYRFF